MVLVPPRLPVVLDRFEVNRRDWCRVTARGTSYIEPGSPWQNPYVEGFGSWLRDELLAVAKTWTTHQPQLS